MRKIVSTIPAQAGWLRLCRLIDDENRLENFVRVPIIGWAFGYENEEDEENGYLSCYPLGVEVGNIGSDENRFGLLRTPEGQVIEPFVGSWDSEADALAEIQEREANKKSWADKVLIRATV